MVLSNLSLKDAGAGETCRYLMMAFRLPPVKVATADSRTLAGLLKAIILQYRPHATWQFRALNRGAVMNGRIVATTVPGGSGPRVVYVSAFASYDRRQK